MSNYLIQGETLTNIANAIRTKTGKTDSIATENMATEISGIAEYPLYDGATEEINFNYEFNGNTYSVSSIGNVTADYITIPKTYNNLPITAIRANAFYNHSYVKGKVTIGSNITKIGSSCFRNTNITNLLILGKNVTMETHAFFHNKKLTNVTILGGQVGDYSFRESSILETVNLAEGVTYIGTSAFTQCVKISSMIIPDSVTTTGSEMFYGCYGLKTLKIGSGMTIIPQYMCAGCTGLQLIDFRSATSVPTLSNANAFSGIPTTCKIVVPDSLYNSWIVASNWTTYASKIVKASEYTEA